MNIHTAVVTLAAAPEAKTIGSKDIVELRVADRSFGRNAVTKFYTATVSGRDAENARRLTKGDSVFITGSMQAREYTNKKGIKVQVDEMPFCRLVQVLKSDSFFAKDDDAGDAAAAETQAAVDGDDPLADLLGPDAA